MSFQMEEDIRRKLHEHSLKKNKFAAEFMPRIDKLFHRTRSKRFVFSRETCEDHFHGNVASSKSMKRSRFA